MLKKFLLIFFITIISLICNLEGYIHALSLDVVSAYKSKIIIDNKLIPADGQTASNFTINLQDANGNFINANNIEHYKIFSNNKFDEIWSQINNRGQIIGTIKSTQAGISTLYTRINEVVLFSKPEITFHLPSDDILQNVGANDFGNYLETNLFDTNDNNFASLMKAQLYDDGDNFTKVDRLKFEPIGTGKEDWNLNLKVDFRYSYKVTALDKKGRIVKSYTGEISLQSNNEDIIKPKNYLFSTVVQGEQKFEHSLLFTKKGNYTIEIVDVSNPYVKPAEINVTVGDEKLTKNESFVKKITLLGPTTGTTNNKKVTIYGKIEGDIKNIDVYDGTRILNGQFARVNGIVKLQKKIPVPVSSQGTFTFQTPKLAEGKHEFMVTTPDKKIKSEKITIILDHTPPKIMAIETNPPEVYLQKTVDAGADFQIITYADTLEPLLSARCSFDNQIIQLQSTDEKKFIGTITAPQTCGEYKLECIIADLQGNEKTNNDIEVPMIKVCRDSTHSSAIVTIDTDQDGIPDSAEQGDTDRDSVPDYLESNKLDSNGNGKSDQMDTLNDTDGGGVANIVEKMNLTDPLDASDDQVQENLVTSVVQPVLPINIIPEKNNSEIEVNPVHTMHSSSVNLPPDQIHWVLAKKIDRYNDRIMVYWEKANDDNDEISKYRIEFGLNKNKLNHFDMTIDDRTQWYIEGLDLSQKYFFRVIAIDKDGLWGMPSPEYEISPLMKTGGNIWWGLLFLILFLLFFWEGFLKIR